MNDPTVFRRDCFKPNCATTLFNQRDSAIYVLRTSLPKDTLAEPDVVARYKNLADVERFFRTLNSELDVRPIRHRLADRVRAHMFLRMLSYYLSWHMKQVLAPILFQDTDKPAAAAKRANPVTVAKRSDQALRKAARKRTDDDTTVHSFATLLADLATICANQIQPHGDMPAFTRSPHPHRCSGGPSNSSASPTATAWRSQYNQTRHTTKPQLNTTTRQQTGGNFGLERVRTESPPGEEDRE